MKRFLLEILCASVLFLGICWIVEQPLYNVDNLYSWKYRQVTERCSNIKILAIGNSYGESCIDYKFWGDSVFAFANAGRWIAFDVQYLEKLLPQMSNLKIVVFPMGYSHPFESSCHSKHLDQYKKQDIYRCIRFQNARYDKWPRCYFLGSPLIRGELRWLKYQNDVLVCDSLGFVPLVGHESEDWRQNQNIKKELPDNSEAEWQVAEYTQYLKDLAILCEKYNKRFIVYTPPYHNCYLENLSPKGLQSLERIILDVKKCAPIEYYDFMADEDLREDNLFFNASHLNSSGAILFAKKTKLIFDL